MIMSSTVTLAAFFFLPAGRQPTENPWKGKVAAAVARASESPTPEAFLDALQTAWRADEWEAGLSLARQACEKFPQVPELRAAAARAFWRAGYIAEAEKLAATLPPDATDPTALRVLLTVHLARGESEQAQRYAEQLDRLKPRTAENLYYLIAARSALGQLAGLSALVREAEALCNPANGYPELFIRDQLQGVAEFLDAVGPEPLNQVTTFGSAAMPMVPLINLPGCDARINGRGPYRLIVDTGGSITLSLDDSIAAELGLKSVATSAIHGVGGREDSGQVLVDELKIGSITCRRVMTRTFAVRQAVAFAADGILGTGLFADARMQLDFQKGVLTVEPASDRPGPGVRAELRIVGDGKLIAPVTLAGQPATCLLDTGADACALSPARLRQIFPGRPIRSLPAFTLGVGSQLNPGLSLSPGADLELAGRKYPDYGGIGLEVLDTLLSPLLGMQIDALVGMPVMRNMRLLTIDYPSARMWIDWLDGQP
jgi:hypothetical protein